MSMDIKQIQDLIKFVAKSGVNAVAIVEEHFKITITTNQAPTYVTATVQTVAPLPVVAPAVPAPEAAKLAATKAEDTPNYPSIKSPMLDTFYRSSSPAT